MLIDLSHFLWAYRQVLVTTAPHRHDYALAESAKLLKETPATQHSIEKITECSCCSAPLVIEPAHSKTSFSSLMNGTVKRDEEFVKFRLLYEDTIYIRLSFITPAQG